MTNTHTFLAFLCFMSLIAVASAIEINSSVPHFEALDDQGKRWDSKDHIGKKIVVIYFYPADMTGGCTAQACGYRDHFDAFTDLNAEVIGVSGDTVGNHKIFKKAHNLNFTLLADTDGKIAELFGVPVTLGEKTVTKTVDGVDVDLVRSATSKRWTFVIDRNGKIVHRDDKVNAKSDPDTIKDFIEAAERSS
ncbi:MAG: peroxiredoxin [Pirellulales bacterium]